jgi:hypothetical protein
MLTLRFPPPDLPEIRLNMARRDTALLLALVLATRLMPVSYRAGADHDHPHTIFQGLIDAVVGHSHHHHHTVDDAHSEPDPSVYAGPDAPNVLELSMPISSLTAIAALGFLIAALLAGIAARPGWSTASRLVDRTLTVEPPPPRPA